MMRARKQTVRKRKVAKRARAPTTEKTLLYFVVRKVADLETGEDLGALVPMTKWDREEMRLRRYSVNTQLRAALYASRNPKFHRLTHAIGNMMREHVAGFETLSAHEVIKRLQLEANTFCSIELIDATPAVSMVLGVLQAIGRADVVQEVADLLPERIVIERKVAQSIAFDSMDEGEFQECFAAIFTHMGQTYFDGIDAEAMAQIVEAYELKHN
jgi:hypothetical protein